jgi:hypothetical protein
MKWRFAWTFLLSFAILMALWGATNFAHLYRGAVLATVQLVSPVVNGWWLDYDLPGFVDPVVFRSGDSQLPMLLQLPALSVGMMPLISLIVATPGLGVKRTIVTSLLGVVLYFLLDVAVVLAYPVIMDRPNAIKDTLGVFTGLVAFAVAPLGLWFVLTYPTLRSLWQLGSERR